jgi:hypothetical protein
MVRLFAVLLLVGCSASAGDATFEDSPEGEPTGMAGAATEPTAGSPTTAGASAGGLASGGSSAGSVVAKGGQDPEPTAGAPTTTAGTAAVSGSGGTSPTTAGAGGSSAGQAPTAGTGGAPPTACPADFYCHELGPDAFAKCVTRPAPDDPQFPTCEITEGACFYPKDAPESCIKAECWSKKRTCD